MSDTSKSRNSTETRIDHIHDTFAEEVLNFYDSLQEPKQLPTSITGDINFTDISRTYNKNQITSLERRPFSQEDIDFLVNRTNAQEIAKNLTIHLIYLLDQGLNNLHYSIG